MNCKDIFLNKSAYISSSCTPPNKGFFTSLIASINCWIENGEIDLSSTDVDLELVDNGDGTSNLIYDGTVIGIVVTTATDVVLTDNLDGTSSLIVDGVNIGNVNTTPITTTSQLTNDGDGTNNFATVDQLHADDDVETVTGTAVDNTDPRNPVIDLEITTGTGAPTGATPTGNPIYIDSSTGDIYTYDGITWNLQGGSTDTNVTAVSKTLNADRQLQVNVTEDGATVSSTALNIGSPWLATNTDKPFVEGLDTGDIYAPKNVYFDGKSWGISTNSESISFGKIVDTHNRFETTLGVQAGDGVTADFGTFLGARSGLNSTLTGVNCLVGSLAGINAIGANIHGFGYGVLIDSDGNSVTAGGDQSGRSQIGDNGSFWGAGSGDRQNGNNNTGIGRSALRQSTGDYVTGLGMFSMNLNTFSNVTGVGANTNATKNNQVVLGDVNVLEVFTEGAIVTNLDVTATAFVISSDSRLKTVGDIVDTKIINGNSVNMYKFTYTINGEASFGYVAQELETALQGKDQYIIDLIVRKKVGVDVNATLLAINNAYSTTHATLNGALNDSSISNSEILKSIRNNGFTRISLNDAKVEYEALQVTETLTTSQQDRLDRYKLVNWGFNTLRTHQVIANDIRSVDFNKLNLVIN